MPFAAWPSASCRLACCALLLVLAACSTTAPPAGPARTPAARPVPTVGPNGQVSSAAWEADIRRFEAADALNPPPRGANLFVGSSSIRLWQTLATDFPASPVINRGFGGSEVRDSTWYADRIVIPCQPRRIVFYAGDNDLNSGRTPDQVAQDFADFVARVRRDLPEVPIIYIAIKPSPSRAHLLPAIVQANTLVRRMAAGMHAVAFADVFTPMLGADGQPRASLFLDDQLHMNAQGYALWRRVLAPWVTP